MTKTSRYVPAEVKRQVLVESGHMCAVPACHHPAVEIAHIEPYSKVREHDPQNLIALCPNHHDQFDRQKTIDKKSMKIYKMKLQFLNKRYTKYEMRLLSLLADKPAVVAGSELQTMGLLEDGLIENAKTFMTQSVSMSDDKGNQVFKDESVQMYEARLTPKGREFIKNWKSESESFQPLI